jgi:uncharacterized protein (DUF1330 family)
MQMNFHRWVNSPTLIAASFLIGTAVGAVSMANLTGIVRSTGPKPAYLVASWDIREPDKLQPFVKGVIPLAQQAGLQSLASSTPEVLEGLWPYRGTLIIQKYDSMKALRRFWNSSEHAGVKELRAGLIDSHFVVGVESE